MSTGIGHHKMAGPKVAICPYCNFPACEADWVDVGVGEIQGGPYHCPSCEASEASYLDTRVLTPREQETGWYEPGSPVSGCANTVDGILVSHTAAKAAYRLGRLDDKTTWPPLRIFQRKRKTASTAGSRVF